MTRPQVVRHDTMELQNHQTPSAQDHARQPTRPAPLGSGRSASHHAEQDARGETSQSPDRLNVDDHGVDIYDEPEEMTAETGTNDGQNGQYSNGMGTEEGELTDGEGDDILDDDLMDKISSSPSIDDEDIDFEFVYALHTFVATVEGQANATKGDTMVLLDDSNSYWWLVRVVKDGSIGYLPAEHIETPTERLARLNKHRNIDLSATMLGDNPEKSKNPLKKAMRRRNTKTVTFTSPTYFEASDIEYSTDEEQGEGEYLDDEDETSRGETQDLQDETHNENIVVEPLRPRQHKRTGEFETAQEREDLDRGSPEKYQTGEEISDGQAENPVSRSRNGTVRDSFFKDDSVETKKISLTPNLLRDDSNNNGLSNDTKESRGSLEAIDKALQPDKVKDDKRRKEKKPGMLSGLFKRKDKKSKASEDEIEETEKSSGESSRSSPQPKTSSESLSQESRSSKPQGPQRQSSKLQKQPPAEISVLMKEQQEEHTAQKSPNNGKDELSPTKEDFGSSIRQVVSPQGDDVPQPLRLRSPEVTREAVASPPSERSKASTESSSPVKMNQPTDFQVRQTENASRQDTQSRSVVSPPLQFQQKTVIDNQEALSESPVNVSPLDAQGQMGLMGDASPQDEPPVSPLSPSSSPELVDEGDPKRDDGTPASTPSSSANTPTWSDASLRSYLDDENDIRDLLIIVHDKSNVPPAGPDHPITGSLFKEESKRLKEMTSQLDEMLANWISRKLESATPK
ncbi:hypothetical protein VTN00DRAFT_2689 [Thermoascus crustaceus]|uniref:uncharacterized protein n=1 Tax=Thermoascus crustaceus TaxID=5088 RepID=UPI003743899C